jgi:hypothetical protein
MRSNRGQVNPEIESDAMSRPATSFKVTSDQLGIDISLNVTPTVWKETVEQRKPRRRSLDNMLGDDFCHYQRNKEDIVRETLRQVN